MAKALLGYAEMRRLQQRVQDLESELVRIQAENDALAAAASHDRIMESIDAHQAEPALT
jgi:cell division protein FtsB